jgi:hypothetical protein
MTRARGSHPPCTAVFSSAAVHSKEASRGAFVKPDIAKPTSFGQVMDRKAPFTKALNSLEKAVEALDLVHALRVCVKVKGLGLKPTAQFYRMLMMLFEEKDMLKEIVATFDDAVKIGVTPDREMWNHLLKVGILLSYVRTTDSLVKGSGERPSRTIWNYRSNETGRP